MVSFLMHIGVNKKLIHGHLLAFSAAAPVFAISTYFILTAVRNTRRYTQTDGRMNCMINIWSILKPVFLWNQELQLVVDEVSYCTCTHTHNRICEMLCKCKCFLS